MQPRQNLLAAAGKIGEASQEVMEEIGETAQDMDKAFQVCVCWCVCVCVCVCFVLRVLFIHSFSLKIVNIQHTP